MSLKKSALVVGLGGVTNGGKTTMCHSLKRLFSSDKYNLRVLSMHLDHYFRSPDDPNHIHLSEYNHHDWDSLNALHIDKFVDDIENNRYNCDILLVEGFLIFNIPSLVDKYDLTYYFDLPYDECLRRRSGRHYDPPDPPNYFQGHVWNAFLKAKQDAMEIYKEKHFVIVNTNEQSFDKIEENIVKDIQRELSHQ